MTPYKNVHIFEDFGMIAGAYKQLSFACSYPDGTPIPLGSVANFGCVFSLYGNEGTSLFNIGGIIDPTSDGSVMIINIMGYCTENLSNCKLVYQPYIIDLERQYLPGQGYITIFAATPISLNDLILIESAPPLSDLDFTVIQSTPTLDIL